MIIKLNILLYTLLHGFFTVCDHCLMDSKFWTPYYIIDGTVGGGVVLWYISYLYCKATRSIYKVAAFMTMLYALYMLLWNIVIPAFGYNRSDTRFSFLLTLGQIVVIYYTVFVPNGRLTNFIDEHLKRIKL